MNTKDFNSSANGFGDLDALFDSARESQPSLLDDNFTKIVLNSLPSTTLLQSTQRQGKQKLGKSLSFDLVGALLGMLCLYLFVDLSSILNAVLSAVPESLVVSPVHLIGGAAAFMVASIGAWWASENIRL